MASSTSPIKARHATPEAILGDTRLAPSAKRALLMDWQRDLLLMQNATAENMPVLGRPERQRRADEDAAELLQRVTSCLVVLEAPESP